MTQPTEKIFTPYQIFMIAVLAFIQFTVILDFMVLSPLGAILMPTLKITTSQFGFVVSAYAFSAGASGLLAAGFADKFDRKKFLLFFYVGFIIGTALCASATNYNFLLFARIFTGIFGGVIGSVGFAIISDLFKLEVRGRVMGFVQMAFAASQVLGLPIGLLLANSFDWHAPFWMIVGVSTVVGIVIFVKMKPVTEHLKVQSDSNAFQHLAKTISEPHYLRAFLGTILLSTGGFMLMPFGSAYGTNNLGLKLSELPIMYGVTGIFSIFFGPMIGKLSDKLGKFNTFLIGSIISIIMVGIYTQLGITPLWVIIILNVILFTGISARMISSSALMTAIPSMKDRGAFMSINSSIQQISGGVASFIAGLIVVQQPNGILDHYDILGYTVIGSMVVAIGLIYWVDQYVRQREESKKLEDMKV
ncbi:MULTISPECIES: MFS transporter [unclassified Arcicella]|uniref:MFS transporter n=1 Tax=unclassified Arcicella TaxID=2644986 RepID=UPI0028604F42|nr:MULTISPECIES: MFS transporter [unclassified Arcicella]MDR6562797.1 putative MFS family arabinose efflux permease [Arcicella sp. BE51]MDR6812859.1 putative MFS family arabinose efflux permease [Arcicella sp. BE140]MDR6824173.1 putative MFS family arabinose efflux permease [Arcicella sp. BE139]